MSSHFQSLRVEVSRVGVTAFAVLPRGSERGWSSSSISGIAVDAMAAELEDAAYIGSTLELARGREGQAVVRITRQYTANAYTCQLHLQPSRPDAYLIAGPTDDVLPDPLIVSDVSDDDDEENNSLDGSRLVRGRDPAAKARAKAKAVARRRAAAKGKAAAKGMAKARPKVKAKAKAKAGGRGSR